MFTYGSLFAGIGGMDLGLERAGMTCSWQVEIEAARRGVLARHWPGVPRWRDVRHVQELPAVDLVAGGFPCQGLSLAGRRQGLVGDERSRLWFEFHRLVTVLNPRWVVVENVRDFLSSGPRDPTTGRTRRGVDFAIVLAGLTGVVPTIPARWGNAGFMRGRWYNVAWRVLDAQYWRVPQRRRRVFIVANLAAAGGRCAEVLFESAGGPWDTPPRGKAETPAAGGLAPGTGNAGGDGHGNRRADVASTLTFAPPNRRRGGSDPTPGSFVIVGALPAYRSRRHGHAMITQQAAESGHVIAYPLTRSQRNDPTSEVFVVGAYNGFNGADDNDAQAGHLVPAVEGPMHPTGVRQRTPVECERLQAFPDGWTARGIADDGREFKLSDSARYRAIGEAVCVNVAEWIGRRILASEAEG